MTNEANESRFALHSERLAAQTAAVYRICDTKDGHWAMNTTPHSGSVRVTTAAGVLVARIDEPVTYAACNNLVALKPTRRFIHVFQMAGHFLKQLIHK